MCFLIIRGINFLIIIINNFQILTLNVKKQLCYHEKLSYNIILQSVNTTVQPGGFYKIIWTGLHISLP